MEKKFKEGDCVYLSSNPEIKMTVSSYQNKGVLGKPFEKELTGYVFCTWLFEGDKKEDIFNQDALSLCGENNNTSSS